MIWTAITYSTSEEKISCEIFEGPMDFSKAYGAIVKNSKGIVLTIIKGNHETGAFVPDISLSLTRTRYNGEF